MEWLCCALVALWPQSPDSLGERIVDYAESKLGQQVGNGQCTALAVEALRQAGAERPKPSKTEDGKPSWGRLLDQPSKIQPGDILVFEDAVFVRKRRFPNGRVRTITMTMEHHVAIVQAVQKTPKALRLAILHQNAGLKGKRNKRVQRWVIQSNELVQGTVRAYRPIKRK